MLVFDPAVTRWVGTRLGIEDFGPSSAIGIARDGQLVAGAVFNNFHWPTIEITFASSTPRWASRQVIGRIFRYPFIQLKCRRVTAVTEATNQPARVFLCRLGFRQEGYHPEATPTGDAVTYGLLRTQCRWLAEDHPLGQIQSVSAASA